MSAKELLIQLFNLPKGEIIFQDYSCALRGLFSKYGRIFLAENHICFYANLGGSKTKLVIKLDDVKQIQQKKGDIEISLKDEHIYCFNSFNDKDQVYSLMNALLTGQPVNLQAATESKIEEKTDQGEDSQILENADVEVSFLAQDGSRGEAEQELCKLTFQFNVDKFFDLFLADEGAIYSLLDHRTSQQDTETTLSKWQPMEDQFGSFQRELKTVIKLVNVPFKDKSRMHKLQTYKKEEGKLVLTSTTHTLDVPYGGYFQLEEKWEITNLEDNKCILRMYGWILFTKSTMMKKTIIPRTLQGVKEDYEKWANNVKAKLEQLAKPQQKASSQVQHEYEDSKNLNDINLVRPAAQKPNKKVEKQMKFMKSEMIFLGTIGILIIIMMFQLLIMNRQHQKLENLEMLVLQLIQRDQQIIQREQL